MDRRYPVIPEGPHKASRPVSFVCVRFSDEFGHNIEKSPCVHDGLNEFIVVDNRLDFNFVTLGDAMVHGIKKATNDLVVCVHEDVLLLPNWQPRMEACLSALEAADPNWFCAGSVGWDPAGQMVGHVGDPHGYYNTLKGEPFARVEYLDEQIIIFRKSGPVRFDCELPSIHNIGRDLARLAGQKGLAIYAIDAATIHKYADADGRLVKSIEDSVKIKTRNTPTYRAERACSDEYLMQKWEGYKPFKDGEDIGADEIDLLASPIILLGRGGSGTRLLSQIAHDVGLFIGNDINASGDSVEMVAGIYQGVLRKYKCPNVEQKKLSVPHLRSAARAMLGSAGWPDKWGFKLPEAVFILPQLAAAFPKARYAVINRDPQKTALRRSHMTGRPDNAIGRTVLAVAYKSQQQDVETLLADHEVMRMARSTLLQQNLLTTFKATQPPHNWLDLSFEAIVDNPLGELERFAHFCGLPVQGQKIAELVDKTRAADSHHQFPPQLIDAVSELLRAGPGGPGKMAAVSGLEAE